MAVLLLQSSFIGFLLGVTIIGLPINIGVMCVYGRRSVIKTSTVTCVLLFAANDLTTCVLGNLTLIFTSLNNKAETSHFTNVNSTVEATLCTLSDVLSLAMVYLNLCLNVIITINQYYAITSMRVVSPMTTKLTLYSASSCLVLSIVTAIIVSLYTTHLVEAATASESQLVICETVFTYGTDAFHILFFVLATLLITLLDIKIFLFIRKKTNQFKNTLRKLQLPGRTHRIGTVEISPLQENIGGGTRNHVSKVSKMLVCSTAMFIVTWTPTLVIILYTTFTEHDDEENPLSQRYKLIYLIVYNMNRLSSIQNPIIYALMNVHFRREFISFCKKARGKLT